MKKGLFTLFMFSISISIFSQDIKIISTNILFKNKSEKSIKALKEIILMADIVGLQEINPYKARRIAKSLNYNVCTQSGLRAIMTKHEIIAKSDKKEGLLIKLKGGKKIWIFNLHLPPAPYGPYEINQIGGIFGSNFYDKNSQQDIDAMIKNHLENRTNQVEFVRFKKAVIKAEKSGFPIFVTGDFNEPSHLDWTKAAVDADLHAAVVNWPTSVEMYNLGFKDSWRTFYTNEVKNHGNSWSPHPNYQKNRDKDNNIINEPFDRIDFIYYKNGVKVTDSALIGPKNDKLSRYKIEGFSSDHRSLLSSFSFLE